MHCSIPSCFCDSSGLRISRHRFPLDPVQRLRWQQALSSIWPLLSDTFTNGEDNKSQPRICSSHFREQDFYLAGGKKRLKCTAVPCLNLGNIEDQVADKENIIAQTIVRKNVDLSSSSKLLGANRIPLSEQSRNVPQSSTRQQLPMDHVDHYSAQIQPSVDTNKVNETEWKRTASIASLDQAPTSEVDDQVNDRNKITSVAEPVAKPDKKQRLFRYAGDIKNVDQLSLDESKQALRVVQKQLKSSQQNVKKLKQRNRRLERKNKSLESVMNDLKARGLISGKGQLLLQRYSVDSELQKELIYGRHGKPYSTALRSFATTLLYYSPKAYRFVREQFNKNLPHENTVVRWYRRVGGSPGITDEALAVLETKAEERAVNGQQLFVALCMDEMAIRQNVQFNTSTRKIDGGLDYGGMLPDKEAENVNVTPATEALVFVVMGIDENFKIPVAYFFSDGLNSTDKKVIVSNVLNALEEAKVKVIGFTFDGTSANISTVERFGCHLRIDDQPLVTNFKHPSGGHNVYVILDGCHMMKLVRNNFAAQKSLHTMHAQETIRSHK